MWKPKFVKLHRKGGWREVIRGQKYIKEKDYKEGTNSVQEESEDVEWKQEKKNGKAGELVKLHKREEERK